MAYNGAGVFQLIAGNPVVTGTIISSTWANNTLSDIANNGLTNCLTKDGQSTPTANIGLGGFRLSNVGAAVSRSDAPNAGQVQDSSLQWLGSASGTDTITASTSVPMTVYVAGQTFRFISAGTNATNAVTLNVDGIGAKNVTKNGANPISRGDIPGSAVITVTYDGTQFQMISVVPLAHGSCRLTLSGGNLVLSPYNGSGLIISGSMQSIPAAGVSLAPTGALASTFYYIYAFMNAGVLTLEFSTTGRALDANGVWIKSGDPTRTLVGAAFCATANTWTLNATNLYVLSWFNRQRIVGTNSVSVQVTTQAAIEINTSIRIFFISWSDDTVDVDVIGNAFESVTNGFQGNYSIRLDNSGNILRTATIAWSTLNSIIPFAMRSFSVQSEGASHFMTVYHGISNTSAATNTVASIELGLMG